MIYRESALPPSLARAAFCAWQFTLEPHDPPVVQHQIPPDGTTNLGLARFPDGNSVAFHVGPTLAAFTVPVPQGAVSWGLRLRPEAAAAALGKPPRVGHWEQMEADGRYGPLWRELASWAPGGAAPDFRCAATLFGEARGDPCIAEAVDRLVAGGGMVPVAEIAALSHLSERQFRRRFIAATGISPKQYADVQRVRRALILSLEDRDWAGVASEAGFADQPHLARDIKERFGAGPTRVVGYLDGIRHELLEGDHVRNLQAPVRKAA
jgi:AraC-like DNA-binding protein